MIDKLYSLKKYLNNFGFLSEAFKVEALVKFAKLTQTENTSLFEESFPDEDSGERKNFADRFYEIFKFLKDDEMYRWIISSASSFKEIKTKIEECEWAVSSVQNVVAGLGLPPNAANEQAKQYLYNFYEELGSPNYLSKLDGIQSKKDFFALLRSKKKKADESKLEKYDLSAEKIAGLSLKEIEWIIKVLDIAEAGGEVHSADDAISMVKIFNKERDKFDKEIWEFDSYSAAQSYLDSKSMVSEAAYMAIIKSDAQSNEMSKVVYEDERWKVVLIGSTIAGQYWRYATGADSSMCIGTLTNNDFAYYSLDKGVDPYFIIDKKNSHSSNPMRMFTISTERDPVEGGSAQIQGQDNLEGGNVSTMTNANNVGINISKIKETLGSDYNKIISVILNDANSREQTLGRQNADKISNLILTREIALSNLEKIFSYIPEYIQIGKDEDLINLSIPKLTKKIAEIYAKSYPIKFINTFYEKPGFENLTKIFWNLTLLNDDVYLGSSTINSLPNGLVIKGDLSLSSTPIETLPEDLVVGGGLYLISSKIKTIPSGLSIGGKINLRSSLIETLPENLEVNGDLNLTDCVFIKELPDNLIVRGNLLISRSSIESLPEGLVVEGDLRLDETKIKTLPKKMFVGGYFSLFGSLVKEIPEGPSIGSLSMGVFKTIKFPDELVLDQLVHFDTCKIFELPKKSLILRNQEKTLLLPETITHEGLPDNFMEINGNLDITGVWNPIWPQKTIIHGDLIISKENCGVNQIMEDIGEVILAYGSDHEYVKSFLDVRGEIIWKHYRHQYDKYK